MVVYLWKGEVGMGKTTLWQLIPYLLPVISYLLGISLSRAHVPKQVRAFLRDSQVLNLFAEGVRIADGMSGMSDTEKRDYVRGWVCCELKKALGYRPPDSVVNYLIEDSVLRRKSTSRSNGGGGG